MRRMIYIAALLAGLMALVPALLPVLVWAEDQGCRACHKEMASPMPPAGRGQPTDCTACHLGDGAADKAPAGHAGLAANPSALDQAARACGPCHPGRAEQVKKSPMATGVGVINQTRFLWGSQPDAKPRYAVKALDGLAAIPEPTPATPVDDLLRRRCLRCHLWVPGTDLDGARRSAGCAACHRPAPTGPEARHGHRLTRRVPVSQCLTCHAGCGAGAEYVGRVPRDEHESARFLEPNPNRPRLWQGRVWRPMRPDLHQAAGLACIDCHPASEVMGDGQVRAAGLLHVGLRCTTCHGRPGRPPAGPVARTAHGAALENVSVDARGVRLKAKLSGKALKVPLLAAGSAAPAAHRIGEHDRLACHACHSALNPAQWGRMALLENTEHYAQWEPMAAQGDPQLLRLMVERLPAPISADWLTGLTSPGIWITAPFFRRFEWRIYGRGPDGRVMLLAPRFAWALAQEGKPARLLTSGDGRPALGVTPWHSHSTTKAAPSCADCHGRAFENGLGMTFVRQGGKEAGLELAPSLWRAEKEGFAPGLDWNRVGDLQGRAQAVFLAPGARPFNRQEINRLLKPGKDYTRWLLKALDEQWPGSTPEAQGGEPQPGGHDGQAHGGGRN